jgi:hypothetical protein
MRRIPPENVQQYREEEFRQYSTAGSMLSRRPVLRPMIQTISSTEEQGSENI